MLFTQQEYKKLIELVSENPCLYNAEDMRFKDNVLKDAVWESIAEQLKKQTRIAPRRGTPLAEHCKQHWKSILKSYYKFKRRFDEKGRANRGSNWDLYQKMKFMDGVIETKVKPTRNRSKPHNNAKKFTEVPIITEHTVPSQTTNPDKTLKLKQIHFPDSNFYMFVPPKNKVEKAPVVLNNNLTSKSSDDSSGFDEIPILAKRRRLNELKNGGPSGTQNAKQDNVKTSQNSNSDQDTDPSISYFVNYLQEVLKKLPQELQTRAIREFDSVLEKYEFKSDPTGPSMVEVEIKSEILDPNVRVKEEIEDYDEGNY